MYLQTQAAKADAFRRMHDRSRILVLPNAWDAASARIIEEAGARAIATTSSGISNSLGYPDGQFVPCDEMIRAVGQIARVVRVPLSADIEAGYASDVGELKRVIRAVIEAGAVGVNLEDTDHSKHALYDTDCAVSRVRAAREAAQSAGVAIVVNARIDVFLRGVGEPDARFDDAVRRANAYRAAGADCLFIPAVRAPEMIEKLVAALDGPLNILAGAGSPTVPELAKLGVARVSVGGGPALAAMSLARKIAQELLGPGTYTFAEGIIGHPEANRLMAARTD